MKIRSEPQIQAMREGGKMLAQILKLMADSAKPGLTPKDMSALAANELKKLGGEPAFLGFQGYPDIICISVNEQVQHSIPSDRPFEPGDVVNFDFGVRYKGMITDAGLTICIDNKLTNNTKRLIEGTKQAREAGIAAVKAGVHVGDVSAAIEAVLKANHLGVVRELVGHGVGEYLHEDPEIPNYGKAGRGPILKSGMTIAIEPIATLGWAGVGLLADGWTIVTRDGSDSAQFEHTVLVTDDGVEILTQL